MRVSRAQADENRETVITVASQLFRKHGFDGIGLKDLMAGAGLTQGAFYKQFESKSDLAVHASARALQMSFDRWTAEASSGADNPLSAILSFYLSEGHRDEMKHGCPIVALGADAARQGPEVKASFEEGIKNTLSLLESLLSSQQKETARLQSMAVMSTMVGAVLLSRSVNDPVMAREILHAASDKILADADRSSERG